MTRRSRAALAAVDPLAAHDAVEPRTDEHLPTWVEYESAPHVFTSENLQKICQVEARFYGEPSYQRVYAAVTVTPLPPPPSSCVLRKLADN